MQIWGWVFVFVFVFGIWKVCSWSAYLNVNKELEQGVALPGDLPPHSLVSCQNPVGIYLTVGSLLGSEV